MIPLIPLKKDSAQGDFSLSTNKKTRQGGWTRKDRELPMDRVNEDPSNHPMAVYPNSTSQSMASPLLPTRDKSPTLANPNKSVAQFRERLGGPSRRRTAIFKVAKQAFQSGVSSWDEADAIHGKDVLLTLHVA
jgi:hypothetical protein